MAMNVIFGLEPDEKHLYERLKKRGMQFGTLGVLSIIKLLRKIGVKSVLQVTTFPVEREDPAFEPIPALISQLQANGSLLTLHEQLTLPDEPRTYYYVATMGNHHAAGGSSFWNRTNALYAALAETVERYVWFTDATCLGQSHLAPFHEVAPHAINPRDFSGFSDEVRNTFPELQFSDSTVFAWVKGYSQVQHKYIYIPAQVVSEAYAHKGRHDRKEPLIVQPITTGLATATSKEEAIVKGMLEALERDAFMLHYYPSVTPPKLSVADLASQDADISEVINRLTEYRLTPHLLYFTTDHPAHAVCCVLEDPTGAGPALILGMRTSFDLKVAVLDAIKEAVVLRNNLRHHHRNTYPEQFDEFTMFDRGAYWGKPEHAHQLTFLLRGNTITKKLETPASWKEQLDTLVTWVKEKKYEWATVDFSNAKTNAAKWHIYLSVCPQLQPMHINEKYAYLKGPRIQAMFEKYGTKPNPIPHPFM